MTRDELNQILTQMGEAHWNPRLLDASTGEHWDYNNNMMACESGSENKELPKDICIRNSMFIEFDMPDDSMIDAGIMQCDALRAKLHAPYSIGKVVLVQFKEKTRMGVYCKDKNGNAWVMPMNKRYRKICLNDDKNAEVVGRVHMLQRNLIEVDPELCSDLANEAMKELELPKEITQARVTWTIKQIQSLITINRWWYSVYRAMVQLKVHTKGDYDGFCGRIKREHPNHEHLPDPVEISRLDTLGFTKPIEKWDINDGPYYQRKRFLEYQEIGLATLALLECEEGGEVEILRKLSETLKKND